MLGRRRRGYGTAQDGALPVGPRGVSSTSPTARHALRRPRQRRSERASFHFAATGYRNAILLSDVGTVVFVVVGAEVTSGPVVVGVVGPEVVDAPRSGGRRGRGLGGRPRVTRRSAAREPRG